MPVAPLGLDETGPIDYVVVEFTDGPLPDPEPFHLLEDLVRAGTIHLLDLQLLRCTAEGEVVPAGPADRELGAMARLVAELRAGAAGVLDRRDLVAAGSRLAPGTTGLVIVFENRWAAPFAVSLRRRGALLVEDDRLPIQGFLASLAH